MRNISHKICRENKNTNLIFIKFSEANNVNGIMWDNMVEWGRPQTTIWSMRIACQITKATDTHSECEILIAFPRQKWLRECVSFLLLYVYCLPCEETVQRGAKWFVLLTQYCAGDKIGKNEMGWACGTYGWGEGVYWVLVGKPEGRRPLGRLRHRWVDNIRTDLQEVGYGYMDWIGLAQDRDRWQTLVSAVMNLRVPWNAVNFLTSCKPVSFSRKTLHNGVSK